jgi:RNA polymerase sigma-70 factor (ECF subfamily)
MSLLVDERRTQTLDSLIAAARAGSNEALGELLEAWRDYLLLVANQELDSVLCPKGGASDLVQQTFLEAQRDLQRFDGSTIGEWVAWLRTILDHNVANFRRGYLATEKRNVKREVPLGTFDDRDSYFGLHFVGDTQTPSQCLSAGEQALRLKHALSRLPELQRRVIELRHRDGLSFAEIGRLTDRSAEAARKLWSRAIKRLAHELVIHHERT